MKSNQIKLFASTIAVYIYLTSAQLSYHNDANTNSYTLNTPNSQQSFVRYYGGNGNSHAGGLRQLQPQQHAPLQAAPLSQNEIYQSRPGVAQNYYQQEQPQTLQQSYPYALLQQQQQQQQQQQLLSQNEADSSSSAQAQSDLAVYYQQIQQQQEQQRLVQQQQQYSNLQLQQPQQVLSSPKASHLSEQYQQAEQPSNTNAVLGVAFSPSNEVSQVKYSSAGLNYNF